MRDIPESDWKVLRELKPKLLERLCERILAYIRAKCDVADDTPNKRFLELLADAQDGNDAIAHIFDGLRRSNAIQRLARMKDERLFHGSEYARLSEPTRRAVDAYKGMIMPSKFAPR